jgi:ribosomal protein S24E
MKVLNQFKNNLLGRTEYEVDIGHDKATTPKKDEVTKKLAEFLKTKPELIKVHGIHTKYGFPKSRAKVYVYDSEETLKVEIRNKKKNGKKEKTKK